MKKFILTLALATFFIAGKLTAQTVYITESGKKYHAKNCDVAKTGKKGIELAEAKKQGYEACKSCKPEEVKAVEPKAADKPKEQPKEKAKSKK
jgi:NOL1/NOP2/fmu family ribosome biogenesis protein